MIDQYLLRYFLAVVEQGNFSRAASHCGVSQPTLSVGISKLEALLTRQLFDRTNRRVALTEAGSRFLHHARRIEAEFAAAALSMTDHAPRATLRLGVLLSLPAARLAGALRDGLPADQALEVMEGRRADLSSLLGRGRVDAILTVVTPGDPRTLAIGTEPYLMALPDDHPLAAGPARPIDVRALAGEAMLVRRHCEALPEISSFFTSHGVRPRIAARTTNDERALSYVRAGLGVTVMPACFAEAGVATVPLAGFSKTRTIGFVVAEGAEWMLEGRGALTRLADTLGTAFGWTGSGRDAAA